MKKLLPLLLATSLLLSACSIDWNDEKDKKIAELQAQIEDDTFKKNLECLDYEDRAKSQIAIKNSNAKEVSEKLDEIFYHAKRKTCIYSTKTEREIKGDICEIYFFYNLLSPSQQTIATILEYNEAGKCDNSATQIKYSRETEIGKGGGVSNFNITSNT